MSLEGPDNIRSAVRDVMTGPFTNSEQTFLFDRFIFYIHTMWKLCSKMSHPVSSDSHFPVHHVDTDRILVKPGDKMDQNLSLEPINETCQVISETSVPRYFGPSPWTNCSSRVRFEGGFSTLRVSAAPSTDVQQDYIRAHRRPVQSSPLFCCKP